MFKTKIARHAFKPSQIIVKCERRQCERDPCLWGYEVPTGMFEMQVIMCPLSRSKSRICCIRVPILTDHDTFRSRSNTLCICLGLC